MALSFAAAFDGFEGVTSLSLSLYEGNGCTFSLSRSGLSALLFTSSTSAPSTPPGADVGSVSGIDPFLRPPKAPFSLSVWLDARDTGVGSGWPAARGTMGDSGGSRMIGTETVEAVTSARSVSDASPSVVVALINGEDKVRYPA